MRCYRWGSVYESCTVDSFLESSGIRLTYQTIKVDTPIVVIKSFLRKSLRRLKALITFSLSKTYPNRHPSQHLSFPNPQQAPSAQQAGAETHFERKSWSLSPKARCRRQPQRLARANGKAELGSSCCIREGRRLKCRVAGRQTLLTDD